jgi:hypothetical protein
MHSTEGSPALALATQPCTQHQSTPLYLQFPSCMFMLSTVAYRQHWFPVSAQRAPHSLPLLFNAKPTLVPASHPEGPTPSKNESGAVFVSCLKELAIYYTLEQLEDCKETSGPLGTKSTPSPSFHVGYGHCPKSMGQ